MFFLNNFTDNESWYGLKKSSNNQQIRSAVYTTTSNVNNLTDTFKNLINGKDTFTKITVIPSDMNKVLSFFIILTKNDSSTKTLKLNIKY